MAIPILVGILFFVIGIALAISSIVTILRTRAKIASSLPAQGVVTGFETGTGRSGYLYYPLVEFQVPAGKVFRFRSSVGTNPARYTVGEQLKILYDSRRPEQAEIDSVTSLWVLPGCMLAMGIAFTALGLFLSSIMSLVLLNQK